MVMAAAWDEIRCCWLAIYGFVMEYYAGAISYSYFYSLSSLRNLWRNIFPVTMCHNVMLMLPLLLYMCVVSCVCILVTNLLLYHNNVILLALYLLSIFYSQSTQMCVWLDGVEFLVSRNLRETIFERIKSGTNGG